MITRNYNNNNNKKKKKKKKKKTKKKKKKKEEEEEEEEKKKTTKKKRKNKKKNVDVDARLQFKNTLFLNTQVLWAITLCQQFKWTSELNSLSLDRSRQKTNELFFQQILIFPSNRTTF